MFKTSLFAAAAIATVAMTGASGMASAHGRHGHFFYGFGYQPRIYVGPPVRDCGYYREMWEDTGRFYWKRRYYECKGWW
jgi:hypothetical protein